MFRHTENQFRKKPGYAPKTAEHKEIIKYIVKFEKHHILLYKTLMAISYEWYLYYKINI